MTNRRANARINNSLPKLTVWVFVLVAVVHLFV
jgi:hypothetical protein